MKFTSWLTGDTQTLKRSSEPESKIERLERLVGACATPDDVRAAAESMLTLSMTIGEGVRLQTAIREYGGVLLGGAPMIVWIDPEMIKHLSIGSLDD